MASAIQFIHEKSIIHRDIKPENILISSDGSLKLADFGWSSFLEDHRKRETYCGTLDYLAPEMLTRDHKHDEKVDIWAIGVLIYELCTGTSPFSTELIKAKIVTEKAVKMNIQTLNYKIPEFLSNECQSLIRKILTVDPKDRLTIKEIIAHPWMTRHS